MSKLIVLLLIGLVLMTSGSLIPSNKCPEIHEIFKENEYGKVIVRCEGITVGYAKPSVIRYNNG